MCCVLYSVLDEVSVESTPVLQPVYSGHSRKDSPATLTYREGTQGGLTLLQQIH